MPWCPKCGNDYRDGRTTCPTCQTELVEGRPPRLPQWLQTYNRVWLPVAAAVMLCVVGALHGYFFAVGMAKLAATPDSWYLSILALPPLAGFGIGHMATQWLQPRPVVLGWIAYGLASLFIYLSLVGTLPVSARGQSPFTVVAILVIVWPSIGAVASLCGMKYGDNGRREYLALPLAWTAVAVVVTAVLLARY